MLPVARLSGFVGALVVSSVILLTAPSAYAQDNIAAARDAYDRGAASYDAGEFALAAQQLAKADQIAPNDIALELALKASVKANDALLAMDLVTRADARPTAAPGLLGARDDARAKMANKVGKVTIKCAAGTTKCSATLDDAPFPTNAEPRFVLAGPHRVVIDDGSGAKQAFRVRVDPGASVPVESAAPALVTNVPTEPGPSPSGFGAPSSSSSKSGISSAWFWGGAGLSAILGGVTVASAIDTRNKHEDFRANPSLEGSDNGVDAQLRTNLLIAGTAAAVVTTAVLGLVFVKWSDSAASGPRATTAGAAR